MGRVKPAQRVRIGIETDGGQILQFFSYVKKVSSDRLKLVFSQSKQHFVPYLTEGSAIKLSIYTPIGILLMDSIVISEPVDCEFEVEFSESSKRIQRRKYVRAKVNYRLIIEQMDRTFTALSEDIGGGGVRFMCDSYLYPSTAKGKLFVPEIPEGIAFTGKILVKPNFKQNEYLVVFEEIDEEDRNKILQKCLQQEAISIRED